jgi:hypothetical protein
MSRNNQVLTRRVVQSFYLVDPHRNRDPTMFLWILLIVLYYRIGGRLNTSVARGSIANICDIYYIGRDGE